MIVDSWLPPLVTNPGNWNEYLDILYQFFLQDFVYHKPKFGNKRVGLKKFPLRSGKEATFWHFIEESENSDGEKSEEKRIVNFRCCERIRWPNPVMRRFSESEIDKPCILWWKTTRQSKTRTMKRYVLALPDFSYVVIVEDRGDYVLPWTQYPVEYNHRRKKMEKEYNEYWAAQKARDAV
jgi:hypothetical protein